MQNPHTFRRTSRLALAIALAGLTALGASQAVAAPNEMNYQAQLISSSTGNAIVSNDVDVTVTLWNDATSTSAGALLATFNNEGLDLSGSQGYVSLALNLSGVDLSGDVYVELTVDDQNDAAGAETLTPRQKIGSVPFALNTASLGGLTAADLQAYADNAAAGVTAGAASAGAAAATTALSGAYANFNRVIFVNEAATQTATPNGQLENPFDNLTDAYAYAKTLPAAGSFFNRIAIVLMPGEHTLTSTLVMDTVGIDIVGFAERTAFIDGTADPLIEMTAGTSGAAIRDVLISPSGTTNVGLAVNSGGRAKNVTLRRTSGTADVLQVNAPNGFSLRDFEIYGNVTVSGYGVGANTTFTDGFITGNLVSTGTTTGTEFLGLVNLSGIGSVNFNPAGAGAGVGILAVINLLQVGTFTISGPETVIQMGGSNINGASIPNPLSGSVVANSIANVSTWTSAAASPGNLSVGPAQYVAYIAK